MVGNSHGYFGLYVITTITKPFTPGEDVVMRWASAQDSTTLADLIPLRDGRDYCVFWREYSKQSYAAALEEHDAFIRLQNRLPKQHGSSDTPTFN